MLPYEKIAKILRTDKDIIKTVEEKMAETIGHNSVLDNIAKENENIIQEKLEILGIKEYNAAAIFNSIIDKIKIADDKIFDLFEKPKFDNAESCKMALDTARDLSNVSHGLFLKEEKAREFLLNIPPKNILEFLNYKNSEEMLKNENLFEVFAALRFIENNDWLNSVFFKQYENLTPNDFEKREIRINVLSNKWKKPAENFLKKKYHNISHLKEFFA